MDPASYRLHLRLIRGSGLVVRDSTGSSDPYVLFRLADKQLGRSRVINQCLEPVWDEEFNFAIDSLTGELELRVYDRDLLSIRDDYMGRCLLPLAALRPGQQQLSLRLPLADETGQAAEACMGDLQFTAALLPAAVNAATKPPQMQESVVNVGLIDIVGLTTTSSSSCGPDSADDSTLSNRPLYAQLQLGEQTCRSRLAHRGHGWDEDLRMPLPLSARHRQLDVAVYERHLTSQDILLGRARVPLLPAESRWGGDLIVAPLLDHPAGGPAVRLTLDLLPSLADAGGDKDEYDFDDDFGGDGAIGCIGVRVAAAELLKPGASANSAAGAFCTVRLGNSQLSARLAEASGRSRELRFRVRDLHSELQVAVFEEAKRQQQQPVLLGRLALRLPQLLDGADARGSRSSWHSLKDKRLEAWTGGRLRLETRLQYSWIGAAVRAIGPRQPQLRDRPEAKLRLRLVRRDARRCAAFIETAARVGAFANSCFQWEDPARSAAALASYVAIVWNLQPFMLPLAPLALLLLNWLARLCQPAEDRPMVQTAVDPSGGKADFSVDESAAAAGVDDEADTDDLSWLQRARAAQDLLLRLQDGLDVAASSAERLRNLAGWREPRISCLAVALLSAASLALGLLPLRLLALAWGVNKFSKKLLRPGADDSNELLNLLSRVPSDVDLERTRPLPPP
ncbi:hypothetical protein BOX15_Mlig020743g1 [Macrostomum lignano]|uniref:C2 domain-containing protein n=1 Tax=Macrostomum lignano TaxID=282301 RepID=A0A267FJS0_9PLAT|nr:hypothetical protein BOX15_Mlig020743g1 [Macrostomum lignano]